MLMDATAPALPGTLAPPRRGPVGFVVQAAVLFLPVAVLAIGAAVAPVVNPVLISLRTGLGASLAEPVPDAAGGVRAAGGRGRGRDAGPGPAGPPAGGGAGGGPGHPGIPPGMAARRGGAGADGRPAGTGAGRAGRSRAGAGQY